MIKKFVMKNYLIVFLIFVSSVSFAQFSIIWDDNPGTTYNGQTINITKSEASFSVYMHCINTASNVQDIKFKRVVLNNSASFFDQFCDDNMCFSSGGSDTAIFSGLAISVSPGDSSIMKPQFTFTQSGSTLIRYYILDYTTENPIDSVDVSISSSVGIADNISKLTPHFYPNPSNEIVTVNVPSQYSGNKMISLTNINGQIVYNNTAKNHTHIINLEQFNSGIYFCSLKVNNSIIFREKLIIKH